MKYRHFSSDHLQCNSVGYSLLSPYVCLLSLVCSVLICFALLCFALLCFTESNLCYGEGGAGTWSDGKLTTSIGEKSRTYHTDICIHAIYTSFSYFRVKPIWEFFICCRDEESSAYFLRVVVVIWLSQHLKRIHIDTHLFSLSRIH